MVMPYAAGDEKADTHFLDKWSLKCPRKRDLAGLVHRATKEEWWTSVDTSEGGSGGSEL